VKICFQADADLNEDIVTGVTRREPPSISKPRLMRDSAAPKTKPYLQ